MAILKFIESAGNQLLQLDPDLLDQLKPFYGKTFRIEFIEPNYSIDLRPCPDGFIIEAANTEKEFTPDVSLRGSLWAFVRLGKEGIHSDVFENGRITITGDAELGAAFQQVLANIDLDWEALTAKFFGDFAARNLHRAIDQFSEWFNQSKDQFAQNTGEVVQEELKLAPSKVDVDGITDEIETLRSDAARLEARIEKLRAALAEKNHPMKNKKEEST